MLILYLPDHILYLESHVGIVEILLIFQDSSRATYAHKLSNNSSIEKVIGIYTPITHFAKRIQRALQAHLWSASPKK